MNKPCKHGNHTVGYSNHYGEIYWLYTEVELRLSHKDKDYLTIPFNFCPTCGVRLVEENGSRSFKL